MKEAHFDNYQDFEEWRTDLEGDGYTVDSLCDTTKDLFRLRIERTALTPEKLEDPGVPFQEIQSK